MYQDAEYYNEDDSDDEEGYEYEIECDGYESWGGQNAVPAEGWYSQFGTKQYMDFYTFIRRQDEIRGAGSDNVGEFDIMGRFKDKHFKFVKQYRGQHAVYYKGKLKKGVMTGTWEIPGNCDGKFNIQPGWQKWKGKYKQFGQSTKMKLMGMYVGDSGVYGYGYDDVGNFTVKGWKDGET